MPLTLILGPANSAKAGEVFAAFRSAARRGALLVVPTADDAELYARELAGDGALLGSVLTFAGLAAEIGRRAGLAPAPLGELARRRLLRRAVAATPLEALAESAAAPGFADALGELVAELGRALITPQRFAAALERWAQEDPRRRSYARELGALPLAYARELERHRRLDAEGSARAALDALRADPRRWGDDAVLFYGFDDLTRLERDAVETLARVAGVHVTVSLTYEAGHEALAARAEVAEELRQLATRVVELPALAEHYEPASAPALHHLERNLFQPGGPAVPADAAVIVLEAGGELAEAELAARETLQLVREGIQPAQIAVISRHPQALASLLQRTFARYGLRLSARRDVPFTHTALGRAVAALARCAWAQAPAAGDLLTLLRVRGRLERPRVADELESAIRRAGTRDLAAALERLGWTPREITQLRQAADPAGELLDRARRLFALPHRGTAPLLGEGAGEDALALRALAAAVSELREIGEELGPAELLELLEELTVPLHESDDPGAVRLSEPLSIRARRFRCVFILGLQEGEFPAAAPVDPFLPDDLRFEIAHATGLSLRPAGDALARERYLLYASVSRATERLFLSFRSSDEEGNLALPSPFLEDVLALFEPAPPVRRRLLADVVWPVSDAPTPRERRLAEAAEAGATGAGPVWPAPVPERRLGTLALGLIRHTRMVSAGALELFASCPVRWLVERELAPEALEPEPEPLARGDYIHRVLEGLFRRLGRALTRDSLPAALELLEQVMREEPFRAAPELPAEVREAVVLRVAADLRRYLRFEAAAGAGWMPRALELRFGFDDEQALPALELGEGEERVLVRGTLDRVDVSPDGSRAIVRDYKSGAAQPRQQGSRWAQEQTLQLPLYMLAVQRHLRLEPVAGLYQPLSGRDLRPRGVFLTESDVAGGLFPRDGRTPDGLQEELDGAAARALALVGRLRSGELTPCPATCSREGCAHPAICRAG